MGSTAGIGYSDTINNFLGQLIFSGVSTTPFLSAIGAGGLGRIGGIVPVNVSNNKLFPMSQTHSLDAPSQSTVSEQDAAAAGNPRFYNRSQETNSIQLIREDVEISDAKMSMITAISGLAISNENQIVRDEINNQIMMAMGQVRLDLNYSCLGGSFVEATSSAVNGKTRGVFTGITTHRNDLAGAVTLNQSHIDDMVADLWDDGVDMTGIVFVCDLRTAQAIRDIYGVAPESRTIGGVNIQQVVTQGGFTFGILTDPVVNNIQVADANKKYLGLINLNLCSVRGLVNPKEGSALYLKRLSEEGFSEKRAIYGQLGMDYGLESKHGLIYDFTL